MKSTPSLLSPLAGPRRFLSRMRRLGSTLALALGLAGTAMAAPGTITTFAGTGVSGYSGDGGPGTSAQLTYPRGVAVNGVILYIADYSGHRVRKMNLLTGTITTVAGTGTAGFSGDGGAATSATLNYPSGVAVNSANGDLYILDSGNYRIRKVTAATGIITTVVGTGGFGFGGDGGQAASAVIYPLSTASLAVHSGNLYLADCFNNRVRKVVLSTGIITTVAGTGSSGYSGDGSAATSAQLKNPVDVAVDANGNLYISDFDNFRIRKVTAATGIITTVAGTGTAGFSGDGGAATSAQIGEGRNGVLGVGVDSLGNLYIVDSHNYRIRKVTAATGIITTVAGGGGSLGDGGAATSANISVPSDVAFDGDRNLYIADSGNYRIRKVETANVNPAPLRRA